MDGYRVYQDLGHNFRIAENPLESRLLISVIPTRIAC
jgi:hypothetical protein